MDLTGRQNDGAGKNFILVDSTFTGNTAGLQLQADSFCAAISNSGRSLFRDLQSASCGI